MRRRDKLSSSVVQRCLALIVGAVASSTNAISAHTSTRCGMKSRFLSVSIQSPLPLPLLSNNLQRPTCASSNRGKMEHHQKCITETWYELLQQDSVPDSLSDRPLRLFRNLNASEAPVSRCPRWQQVFVSVVLSFASC